jgi:hypothetical protein
MSVQHEASRYDTPAVLSPAAGIASFALLSLPVLSILLAVAAVSFALASRRRLRNDERLRGTRAGLAGFILGSIAFVLVAAPFVIGLALNVLARGA